MSALEPARRTCGGDGSAPSLDAGEPAALPPAAGPPATGTARGRRVPARGRGKGGALRLPSRSFPLLRAPGLSPPFPHLPPRPLGTRPRGGGGGGRGWPEGLRGAGEPTWFVGVGRGGSAGRELPKAQCGVNPGKWGAREPRGGVGDRAGTQLPALGRACRLQTQPRRGLRLRPRRGLGTAGRVRVAASRRNGRENTPSPTGEQG